MVEREGVLETIDGDVSVPPEPTHVVDENVDPWVGGEDGIGQAVAPPAGTTGQRQTHQQPCCRSWWRCRWRRPWCGWRPGR